MAREELDIAGTHTSDYVRDERLSKNRQVLIPEPPTVTGEISGGQTDYDPSQNEPPLFEAIDGQKTKVYSKGDMHREIRRLANGANPLRLGVIAHLHRDYIATGTAGGALTLTSDTVPPNEWWLIDQVAFESDVAPTANAVVKLYRNQTTIAHILDWANWNVNAKAASIEYANPITLGPGDKLISVHSGLGASSQTSMVVRYRYCSPFLTIDKFSQLEVTDT